MASSTADEPRWFNSVWAFSLASSALFWAALPPLNLAPLAWFAPVGWILLARREKLPGRRPYLQLWLTGFAFWLAALYWLTLPHWATAFGWLALSFYLAFYWPVFVGLTRVAVWRLRITPLLAAPVVWTGLELARAHLLGGFMMAGLAHTQYRWIALLQISDLAGSYGVSFVIVMVAACLARMLPCAARPTTFRPLLPLAAVLAVTLAYGAWRAHGDDTRPGPRVALIQGSIDVKMKADPNEHDKIYDQYMELSRQALEEHAKLDLVVWPETMFPDPWFEFDNDYSPPDGVDWTPAELVADSQQLISRTLRDLHTPALLGIPCIHQTAGKTEQFNSAIFVDPGGTVRGRYDKVHLVMFGEYVPLAEYFPWLYRLTPLPGGLNRGAGPAAFRVGQARVAPNICYESTVSHLIRGQVLALRSRNEEPDVLVNVTNDGWFWGSSELDMHLVCGVFRAIECRKPFLIAANTGFSAWIDSDGRILAQGPRRDTGVILAETRLDGRRSWYLEHGDWPAGLCLSACIALGAIGGWNIRSRKQRKA